MSNGSGIDSRSGRSEFLLATAGALLLVVGCYLGQQLSVALRVPPVRVSTIWLPGGILLAALLLAPTRRWWVLPGRSVGRYLRRPRGRRPGAGTAFSGGSRVVTADINGDGVEDLIVGPGGAPRVQVLSGRDLTAGGTAPPAQLANFFAGDTDNRGGVTLAAKFLDEDGKADLVTGAGAGAQGVVTTYLGKDLLPGATPPARDEFLIFDPTFTGGVFVG